MNDKLSQEDIDRMLKGDLIDTGAAESTGQLEYLNETEADTLGEIGNIFMGSAATTLSLLLGQKVEITTPYVKEYAKIEDVFKVAKECVTVEIQYKQGLEGTTVFALNTRDIVIIADLMMGGDGKVTGEPEIGELQLSAVGEAMNQMIGTASTTMSSMLNIPIDITPPNVTHQTEGKVPQFSDDIFGVPIVAVVFNLKIGDLIDSEIIQLMSLSAAQNEVSRLMANMNAMIDGVAASIEPSPAQAAPPPSAPAPSAPAAPRPAQPAPARQEAPQNPVTVQPVQFPSFDEAASAYGDPSKNLDLVLDVKLSLTVELGRTELPIKKVLELTRGSVIELDKIAGEPVELYANGKLIAKGEVVVIEDNFGLRILSIVSPDNRVNL